MDEFSAIIRQVLKVFGGTHPIRVGIGIALGFGLKVFWRIGLAYNPESPVFKALDEAPAIWVCLLLIGAMMLPVAFGNKGAPEEISHQIKEIELIISAANLSATQRRMIWNSLVQKYLNAVRPSLRTPQPIDLIEETRKEIKEINATTPDASEAN